MGARTVARSGSARTQFAETDLHSWARTQKPTWPLQPGRFLAGSTIHPRDHRSAVVLGRQPGASRSVRGGGRTRFHCRQGFAWPDGKSWPSNEARVLGLPPITWLHLSPAAVTVMLPGVPSASGGRAMCVSRQGVNGGFPVASILIDRSQRPMIPSDLTSGFRCTWRGRSHTLPRETRRLLDLADTW